VPEQARLRPGRFWVNRAVKPGRLHFMLPAGKTLASSTVEVSRLQWAIQFDPYDPANPKVPRRHQHVNIRGLSFFGFATHPRCPIIDFKNCENMRLEDCTVRWSNTFGIGLSNCSRITLLRNDVQYCGHLGIGGGRLDHITLEDNITSHNNYKLYSVWWECGGIKLCGITDSVIRRHVAIGNEGEGMWFDWNCWSNVVEDCLSANNVVAGFLNEVAPGNIYRRNIFAFNRVVQGAGISISGSSDTLVENNIFYGNEGTAVDIGGAPGKRAYNDDFVMCNRNRIERNLMAANFANLGTISPLAKYAEDNRVDRNLYWNWKGEQPVILDGRPVSLDDWRKASSNDLRSIVADPLFTDPARLDFTLKRGSPARQVGFKASGMRLDWSAYATDLPAPAARAVQQRVGRSFAVDLTPLFNRALRDKTAGDGVGGWTDQGPNDLRNMPVGNRRFEGVPFAVGTGTLAAVALASPQVKIPGAPREVVIPVGRAARALYFLHTAAWTGDKTLARYTIRAGGRTHELPIRHGLEMVDWWSPVLWQEAEALESHGTFVAWQGANGTVSKVTVFATRWDNPAPDQVIESVTLAAGDGVAAVFLLAITGVEDEGADRSDALRAAAAAARLPRPEHLRFYLPFEGAAVALTPGGEAEPHEARQPAWDVGPFVDGVQGQALHFTTFNALTFDDFPRFLPTAAGSAAFWVRINDWFTDKLLKAYLTAPYLRGKVVLSGEPARQQIRVPADPGRAGYQIAFKAEGDAADRRTTLGIVWDSVALPPMTLAGWKPGEWHHVALTWETDGTNGRLSGFLDGAPAGEIRHKIRPRPPHPVLFLGNARHGGCRLDAALDEVAIWDQALAPEEIRAYRQALAPK
jgi:hypothetical protein